MNEELTQLLEFRPQHLAWPIYPGIVEEAGEAGAIQLLRGRKAEIIRSETDPLRAGYEPKIWEVVNEQIKDLRAKHPNGVPKIMVWGGHRSSKTRYASNFVNKDVYGHPDRRWWCCDSTEAQARANQMRLIYEQFPPEWRNLQRNRVTDVGYSISDGFSKNKCVFPNKSEIDFKFYSMKIESLPGPELDGVWCLTDSARILYETHDCPISKVKIGDLVETRKGLRLVESICSRIADVGTVKFSNDQELTGTFEHPVLTARHGWTRLGELQKGDLCVSVALDGKGNRITHTQRNIISPQTAEEKTVNAKIEKPCIARFGKTLLERYRRVSTFITQTATFLTTNPRISPAFQGQITCGAILPKEEAWEPIGKLSRFLMRSVLIVDRLCSGNRINPAKSSVNPVSIKEQKKTGKSDKHVCNVESHSLAGVESIAVSVVSTWEPAGRQRVYNLRVAGTPEYFANGILVHNCDELVPLSWVEFLVFRLVNRNGILLITFCPEFGWNETFGYFYEGAQIIQDQEASLLPKYDEDGSLIGYKRMPRVMQCADPTARIVFYWTQDNPFGRYDTLKHELKGKSEEEIMIRAYGFCTKSHAAAFPMMNRRVHVIGCDKIHEISKRFVTTKPDTMERYMLVDPCSGRNWFMIWVMCPSPDRWIIYREWPSHGHASAYIQGIGMPGPWAVSGAAADGVMGPAQKSFGFGLQRYEEEIKRQEAGEPILARYIDSRYAGAATLDRERTTTLIEQMADVGMDFLGMTSESRILGVKDGSIDMINSALYYDVETELGKFSPELGRLNEPQLQIVDTCPNTIYALEHWTGQDGQRGACKDPIDCLRGLFLSGVNFVGKDQYRFIGGGLPR